MVASPSHVSQYPQKVYIFWKLDNSRFRLLLDVRQEIKPFPKIAIISQKYIVSTLIYVLRFHCTPTTTSGSGCFTVTSFIIPQKVHIFWKLDNCRFRLLLDVRQEIKPFPKIAIISQKYIPVVSQLEFVSGHNLTEESEQHSYVFFAPWSKEVCQGILIACLVCFKYAVKL